MSPGNIIEADKPLNNLEYWRHRLQSTETQDSLVNDLPVPALSSDPGYEITEGSIIKAYSLGGQRLLAMSAEHRLAACCTALGLVLQRYYGSHAVWLAAITTQPDQVIPLELQFGLNWPLGFAFEQMKDSIDQEGQRAIAPQEFVNLSASLGKDLPIRAALGLKLTKSTKERVQESGCELLLNVKFAEGGIQVEALFRSDRYHRVMVDRLICHLDHMLEAGLQTPMTPISAVEMLTSEEKRQLDTKFSASSPPELPGATLLTLLNDQAEQTPGHSAVVHGTEKLTYTQLDHAVKRLAEVITGYGIGRGDLVALQVIPHLLLLPLMLGILAAGAAYIPIPLSFTAKQAQHVIKNSRAKLLLLLKPDDRLEATQIPTLHAAEALQKPAAVCAPAKSPAAFDRACVLYSFDTEGVAKRRVYDHRTLVQLASWHRQHFELSPDDRGVIVEQWETGIPSWSYPAYLASGATLHIVSEELAKDAEGLYHYFDEHAITCTLIPPELSIPIMKLENRSLRALLTWGLCGSLPGSLPPYRVYAGYSLAQSGGIAGIQLISREEERFPRIKPIAGVQWAILDSCGHLQPAFIPGELMILGKEFEWEDEDKEREADTDVFMNDPWNWRPQRKSYRTGRQARWLPDGTVQLLRTRDRK
ncbi:AMP-binding protein [Paenibacillus sp. CAA11]|uniref:AMP-binding protein n=1 Tax=Paenibacillus sp. CAA11 TaxID=1532905 RepID=UPI00131F1073|nr:AMP-binding protein [Paenibacillus sp. CAA11]